MTIKGYEGRYIRKTPSGLQVVITRLGVLRYFAYGEYGEDALACAIQFRDNLLSRKRLGLLLKAQPRTLSKGGACSLAGVELRVQPRHDGAGTYAGFSAYFKAQDGAFRRRTFSIRKYGYHGAFERAVECRLAYTKLPVDPDTIPLPRPSVEQFVFLLSIASDVPSPHVLNNSGLNLEQLSCD